MPHIPLDAPASTPDLWQTLKEEKRDIFLYGMGNGADKILAVMAARDIPVAGVFASDGFVRGHSFHGMPVRSFRDICATYAPGDCIVLLAFGTARPEVLALIDAVAARYPLYVPDVPVCGDTLFDAAFYKANLDRFAAARALFQDDISRALFDSIISYKLTGRYDHLISAVSSPERERDLLRLSDVQAMADLGAYSGDTARELLAITPVKTILAMEPDPRNFRKLQAWAKTVENCRILPYPAAASNRVGTAAFDGSGNRNAGLSTGRADPTKAVATVTLDSIAGDIPFDYIKYDVEGGEADALAGSALTIARCRPRLKVACYHRSEDLFSLPLLLAELAPHYQFYLTRRLSLPGWDLDILAVPLR